jgi:hypothetical protein
MVTLEMGWPNWQSTTQQAQGPEFKPQNCLKKNGSPKLLQVF